MKILLIGDCSGVHSTLAQGLRTLGHEVCVASDGSGWKNYPRDISLMRNNTAFWGGLECVWDIVKNLHRLRGFDVVQVIHCPFVRLRAERTLPLFRYLKRHNHKIFMGAFGTDHYYVKACLESDTYRYSDFKIGDRLLDYEVNRVDINECLHGGTVDANREIAESCDGIIACLWEYYVAYQPYFSDKTTFIPLPFNVDSVEGEKVRETPEQLAMYIGIQSARDQIKGTDVMLPIMRELEAKYPSLCSVTELRDIPYQHYCKKIDSADLLVDQLYSYTPAMNALLAMAKGIVVAGGGEPENYEIIDEQELRPILNLYPSAEEVYHTLEEIILNRERIPQLSVQSIDYVQRHHHYVTVAQRYLDFWASR